jgi:uncharacterized protein (DUF2164 family)
MGKKLEKNYNAQSDTLLIDEEHVVSLLGSCRWGSCKQAKAAVESAVNEALESLLERPELELQAIDIERLTLVTSDDIIDRFLRSEPRRIVAEEGEVCEDIVTEAEFDDEEEMVSEELAEVYLAQGLKDMAKETYRKLSLLNPEKSIYFAEIISKIDSNN